MSDVYEIMRVILQGSYKGTKRQFAQAMSQTSTRLPEPQATTQVTPDPNIKVENFGAIIAEFTKTMAEILSQNRGVPITMPHITTVEDEVITIEHPFRNAKDAAYTPPTNRNIGVPAPQATKKLEPAYKQQPAIYKASITTDVYSRTMGTPITVTQQELLSLSPEVWAQIREAITTRHIAVQGNQEQPSEAVNFFWVEDSDDEDEPEIPTILTFAIPNIQHHVPPEGMIIIPDPIETYVKSLPQEPHQTQTDL